MRHQGDPARVALITGAATRIGAALTKSLHQQGFKVLIHCRHQRQTAAQLADSLNQKRPDSAAVLGAELSDAEAVLRLAQDSRHVFGPISVLINNASVFAPEPPSDTLTHWNHTIDTNLRAPWLLAQALADDLRKMQGQIINLVDIYADHPLPHHSAYSSSKAGLQMLTKSLALDLAPEVRVNGIAPGAILWPEPPPPEARKQALLQRIPLRRLGSTAAIVEAALFLLRCDYVTGQVIKVDGGRSLAL